MTDNFQSLSGESADQNTETNTSTGENNDTSIQVGDRKFNSIEELTKSWQHSQQFIETLKAEKSEIEGKLSESKKVDEILNKLESAQQTVAKSEDKADQQSPRPSNQDVDIDSLINKKLSEAIQANQRQSTEEANLKQCMEEAAKHFGEKWASILDQKAKELDSDLVGLAKTNPKLFKQAVINTSSPSAPAPTSTSFIKTGVGKKESSLSDITKDFSLTDKRWKPLIEQRFMEKINQKGK